MNIGLYIHGGSKTHFSGVEKKIRNQIKVMSEYFDMHEIIVEKTKTNPLKSILWRLPGGSWGSEYDEALDEIRQIEDGNKGVKAVFIYIRTQPLDRKYVRFLHTLRENHPDAKILLELPTYPYDRELLSNSTMWPWFFKDKVQRRRIGRYIDRIVTYSDDNVIFGIPTLKVMNGIDVDSVKPAYRSGKAPDSITLIAVAMMQPYHGYERLINGLAEYYKKGGSRDICINLVGYGSELKMYQKLVHDQKLEDRVVFKGKLSGQELDDAYIGCDLAVGSLGGYKIGIERFSSIKLGEYLAKGLPVITGAPAAVFEQYGSQYNLDLPNDSSPLDYDKIIEFYDQLYSSRTIDQVRDEIRAFAKQSIDMRIAFKAVVDYAESCRETLNRMNNSK